MALALNVLPPAHPLIKSATKALLDIYFKEWNLLYSSPPPIHHFTPQISDRVFHIAMTSLDVSTFNRDISHYNDSGRVREDLIQMGKDLSPGNLMFYHSIAPAKMSSVDEHHL